MINLRLLRYLLGVVGFLLFLVGCSTPEALPVPSTTLTIAPTPAASPTYTQVPTDTPAPTITPTPTVISIRLEADGSGEYATLKEAVEKAPGGAVILLGPGTFRLEKPLEVRQSLKLVGAGMDQTEIVSEALGYVIRFNGNGTLAAEDVTFRHEGPRAADVVSILGGDVAFVRCRFTGAVDSSEWAGYELWNKAGLRLGGNTTGVVQDCEAVRNGNIGILVLSHAKPVLEGNACSENEGIGIAYATYHVGLGSVARRNDCSRNVIGISVAGESQPVLEENICSDNGLFGIAYRVTGAGTARQNECSRNGVAGIFLGEKAQPMLEENVFFDNGEIDISNSLPLDLAVAIQQLDTLETFRSAYGVHLIEGPGVRSTLVSIELARVKSTGAAEVTVLKQNLSDPNGVLEEQDRMILIGDRIYMKTSGEEWMVMEGPVAQTAFESIAPAPQPELEEYLQEPIYLGSGELVGGIYTHHYRYENLSPDLAGFPGLSDLPQGVEWSNASFDVWISIRGGFLVGYKLALEVILDTDFRAWFEVDFYLLDTGIPAEIAPPEGVIERPFPDEIPVLDDAILLLSSDSMTEYVYATAEDPAAALGFYRERMKAAGWEADPNNTGILQGVEYQGYKKEGVQVIIFVSKQEGQTVVMIIVENLDQ